MNLHNSYGIIIVGKTKFSHFQWWLALQCFHYFLWNAMKSTLLSLQSQRRPQLSSSFQEQGSSSLRTHLVFKATWKNIMRVTIQIRMPFISVLNLVNDLALYPFFFGILKRLSKPLRCHAIHYVPVSRRCLTFHVSGLCGYTGAVVLLP